MPALIVPVLWVGGTILALGGGYYPSRITVDMNPH